MARFSKQRRILSFRIRELTAPVRTLPDFLIIGAQKCGTTSLYAHLMQHPSVGPAFEKEVRYFNDHYEKGVNWYKAHFPTLRYRNQMARRLGRPFVTGEGEPSYLPNPIAPQRVFDLIPDVKIIVMLRNPVSRAYSHYQHRFTRQREARTFEEVVKADKEKLKDGFDGLPTGDGKGLGHLHYSYLPRGIYVNQVRNWMTVFPREQFLIIKAEDFFADTQAVYDDVLAFLDLSENRLEKKKRHNIGKYSQPMSPAMKQDLADYFRPHNQQLNEYLDRDFGWDT
jgi:hypothetical protein